MVSHGGLDHGLDLRCAQGGADRDACHASIRASGIAEKSASIGAVSAWMGIRVGGGLGQDGREGLEDGPVFVGPVAGRHPDGVDEGRCYRRVGRDQTKLSRCERLRQDRYQASAGVDTARFDGGGDRGHRQLDVANRSPVAAVLIHPRIERDGADVAQRSLGDDLPVEILAGEDRAVFQDEEAGGRCRAVVDPAGATMTNGMPFSCAWMTSDKPILPMSKVPPNMAAPIAAPLVV